MRGALFRTRPRRARPGAGGAPHLGGRSVDGAARARPDGGVHARGYSGRHPAGRRCRCSTPTTPVAAGGPRQRRRSRSPDVGAAGILEADAAGAARADGSALDRPTARGSVITGCGSSGSRCRREHARELLSSRGSTIPRCSWSMHAALAVLAGRLSGSDGHRDRDADRRSRRGGTRRRGRHVRQHSGAADDRSTAARDVRRGAGAGAREADLAAFGHAEVPFERVVDAVAPDPLDRALTAVPGDAGVPEHRAGRTSNCRD